MPEINSHEDKLRLKESIAELVETERTYVSRLMTTYKVTFSNNNPFITNDPLDSRSGNPNHFKRK